MARVRYVTKLEQIKQLSDSEYRRLKPVADKYAFRASDYYLKLIDWSNPDDPIRRIVIPHIDELREFGDLDASGEQTNYVAPGCQHKYPHTALLLCNEVCGAYCRFCFRKRFFMPGGNETERDVAPGINYIRKTPQITNVLLTGGDPLMLSSRRIEAILSQLRSIPHVGIIRIGTKMPAFNPYRIIDHPQLTATLSRYSTREKRIYLMVHFSVPQELTDRAMLALDMLMKCGVVVANQSPIIRGVNDDPDVLAELMRKLSFVGVPPYYFFQCRPTVGNEPYELSLVETYQALEEAKKQVSGLAKRARLVMSHETGKVEMVGLSNEHMYLRYHRARDPKNEGRFMIFHRDDEAYWLDDLIPVQYPPHPVHTHGHREHHAIGPE
ncbi:MAG: KamA family radical SAM protein [Candidatus Zixiibacteriota bacterium]|nr:MAG: KamA family radical SAM protein [candidate division Zixibacteria bacterium]